MKNLTRRLTRDNGTYGCSCRPHAVVQRVRPLRIKVGPPRRSTGPFRHGVSRLGKDEVRCQSPSLNERQPPRRRVRNSCRRRSATHRTYVISATSDGRTSMCAGLPGYCERFPQGSDEAIDCWTAHNYLTSEALTAEQQCDLESPDGSTTGKACADFQRWENFVQQVVADRLRRWILWSCCEGRVRRRRRRDGSDDPGREERKGQEEYFARNHIAQKVIHRSGT